MISTGSLWEDSESEAEPTCSEEEIVDSDAEINRAPATPRAKLYNPKNGGTKAKSVVVRVWVEYDVGDVSNQEFPERHCREDHGKKGVSTETFVIRRLLSKCPFPANAQWKLSS